MSITYIILVENCFGVNIHNFPQHFKTSSIFRLSGQIFHEVLLRILCGTPHGKFFIDILKYFLKVKRILYLKNIILPIFSSPLESFRLFPSTNGEVLNSSHPRIVVHQNFPEFNSSRDYYSSKYGIPIHLSTHFHSQFISNKISSICFWIGDACKYQQSDQFCTVGRIHK